MLLFRGKNLWWPPSSLLLQGKWLPDAFFYLTYITTQSVRVFYRISRTIAKLCCWLSGEGRRVTYWRSALFSPRFGGSPSEEALAEEWIRILHQQEYLHAQELDRWRKAVMEAADHLRKVSLNARYKGRAVMPVARLNKFVSQHILTCIAKCFSNSSYLDQCSLSHSHFWWHRGE